MRDMRSSTGGHAGHRGVRVLLVCGVLQGPLWVGAVLAQDALRSGYDPLRHSTSALSLGELGWIQIGNFVLTGLLTLAFAVGVRRALGPDGTLWGPVLIGVWAVCMIGAGAFVTDPSRGYPPGTPDQAAESSTSGVLHDIVSGPGFLALLAACVVFARWFHTMRRPGWSLYCLATAVVCLVFVVLASYGWDRSGGIAEVAGLFQRVSVIAAHTWLTALATHLLLRPAPVGDDRPAVEL